MNARYAIVCTTIFDLEFLISFANNLEHFGYREDTLLIVIPDRKSPPSSWKRAEALKSRGFHIAYPTLEEQEHYLSRFPSISGLIPYNSDNRRNIGFLMALEFGVEILISIDDDNFPEMSHDFVGCHAICGTVQEVEQIQSSNSWYNVCDLLTIEPPYTVFPRGFPYRLRRNHPSVYHTEIQQARIGMNVGLWIGDPDIDAISRNFATFRVANWKGQQVALGPGTWSPINTQNTALIRELIPAYYYIRMGEAINGLVIDRFGDILSGYFTKKVCDHLGYSVTVGAPICDHRRTPHNLFKDLYHELAGIVLLEEFILWLESISLQGSSAIEAYRALAEQIDSNVEQFQGYLWSSEARGYFHNIASAMLRWSDAVERLV